MLDMIKLFKYNLKQSYINLGNTLFYSVLFTCYMYYMLLTQ